MLDVEENFKKILRNKMKKYAIIIGVLIAFIVLLSIGFTTYVFSESKTTKIGFENIGELATQVAHTTELNVTDKKRNLWGMDIPFTQSKYIYSYDVDIKAGFDFKDIEWSENNKTITVNLPKVKTLSNEIDNDSFKVYHEQESIFTPISLEDNNNAVKELKEKAEKNAIANGLYENAIKNAETILTAFFASQYDLNEYTIKFNVKD